MWTKYQFYMYPQMFLTCIMLGKSKYYAV
uniref:Uncharacterized protein n=1 Tax=Arundo donax TaxID=35708 RepID=A0A0A9F2D8_ARUDO